MPVPALVAGEFAPLHRHQLTEDIDNCLGVLREVLQVNLDERLGRGDQERHGSRARPRRGQSEGLQGLTVTTDTRGQRTTSKSGP